MQQVQVALFEVCGGENGFLQAVTAVAAQHFCAFFAKAVVFDVVGNDVVHIG